MFRVIGNEFTFTRMEFEGMVEFGEYFQKFDNCQTD